MIRKSDMVRQFVSNGEMKKALRIAKGFRLGITSEQSQKMTLAYECMVHDRFYRSLGYDIPEKIREGIEILVKIYGGSDESAETLHQQILKS